jgi:hypothetical protein
MNLPDTIFIYSLYLVDQYTSTNNYFITSTNAYRLINFILRIRLLVIGVIIADKILNDENICLKTYSRITKVSTEHLKRMEIIFLDGLGYNTYIKEADFH